MENLDLTVLRTLHGWRAAERRALLATVVRTWGSSPRPVGSIMALCEDGAVVGSVSGGCIEDDLIARHTRTQANPTPSAPLAPLAPLAPTAPEHGIPNGPPAFVKYGISADEAHRFGLPCGGTLELLLEYNPDPARLAELLALLAVGRLVQRSVRLADGAVTLSPAAAPADLALDDRQLTNSFGPEYRMLLIGAGQLTEYLATMAMFNGFAVTVCDPREEYRQSWNLPGAALLSDMPDDVVLAFKPDRRSCVVALTHDPKLDDLALLEALETDAFYVGGIGSRRNHQARRKRMIEHFGQTPDRLARLRGPIGIYIGSKTPPEIAVSVMAEILALKNGVALPHDVEVAQAKNERDLAHNDPGTALCGASPASSATGSQCAPRP
ncbi:XdhC family protein [Verminephrobacter eiseniae]|uniref:XdhC family protein n=1 Tax=Verminephrobacter eiseniae TaxID=364317 RepID=UPI00223912D2|nr:XdhC family protein [Verminephrobacter eiseniae]MCW5238686.1 XdhC family protein [Verminephrobacter eiseniae]